MKHNDLIRKKNGRMVECATCSKSVYRSASQLGRNNFYCSKECWKESAKKQDCLQCGKKFSPNIKTSKFCSQKCWREKVRADNPQTKMVSCQHCGEQFETYKKWIARGGGKFCSRRCAGKARVGNAGSSRGYGWEKTRQLVRERDGACVCCGGKDEGRELSADHIIPWYAVKGDVEKANNLDNLASLCAPCHGVKTVFVEGQLKIGNPQPLIDFYGAERISKAVTLLDPAKAHELGLTKHSWEA